MKALEIDGSLAEAVTSLARIKQTYDWDWEGANREYERAIAINPGFATAHHYYSLCLSEQGHFEQALEEIERAHELDPLSLHISGNIGRVYLYAGEYDKAIQSLRKTMEMDPKFPVISIYLALAYMWKSMYQEAINELQKDLAVGKSFRQNVEAIMGCCHAFMGETEKAQQIVDKLLQQSKQQYIPPSSLAFVYFALEQGDEGFACLEKAYEARDPFLCYLNVITAVDKYGSDPRYIALLRKIGLDQ